MERLYKLFPDYKAGDFGFGIDEYHKSMRLVLEIAENCISMKGSFGRTLEDQNFAHQRPHFAD